MTSAHSQRWRPTASAQALKQAAHLRSSIRQWMHQHALLEVCTPPLSLTATTDPQVHSLRVQPDTHGGRTRYLHTSPEFAMKRILCAYPDTDIYQIAMVYRAEEQGRHHACQFTMLEWYRVGMNHVQLMCDVESLFQHIWQAFSLECPPFVKSSYCQEVFDRLGAWPDQLEGNTIKAYFASHERSFPADLEHDLSASLDLFMDEFVVSEFDSKAITVLHEYPVSQAALARLGNNAQGIAVAERFEVFAGRLELANGFHELADAGQQQQRFERESKQRRERGLPDSPMDHHLLAALETGLPDCAGIALGIDRLHMALCNYQHIHEVLSFADDTA